MVFISRGLSSFGKGNLEAAAQYFTQAKNLTYKLHHFVWYIYANLLLADTLFESGRYSESEHHYNTAVQASEQNKVVPHYKHVAIIGVARAKVELGTSTIDLDLLRNTAAREDSNQTLSKGWKARYIAEVLLKMGEQYLPEAETWIEKAISANTDKGMRFMLGQDLALYSEFYKKQNDLPQAREQMKKAIGIMKECGAEGWMERYEKELAKLN